MAGTVTTSVGLFSGINTSDIIDALITSQRAAAARLESRATNLAASQFGYKTISATLLSVSTSVNTLSNTATFSKKTATVTDATAMTVTAGASSTLGSSTLVALQKATAHTLKSRGFESATQAVGQGVITLARGGELDTATSLGELNNGTGVRRGSFRITDRSGVSADIDLSAAQNLSNVVSAINNSSAAVTASVQDNKLVLTDRSGGSGNLIVRELGGGQTAADLGIAGSVASSTLSGSAISSVDSSLLLSQINDRNPPQFSGTGADLRVGLSDGSSIDLELSAAKTVGDVITAINDDPGSAGKLSASLSNGRIVLQDLTGGTDPFTVTDINGAKAARALGLDATASGATLTGNRLTGGLNSVLLRSLHGGKGISEAGAISITDRTGTTATIDLSGAETLNDVLSALQAASVDGGGTLAISASIDDAGLGLVLRDTSGATVSNLTISDVGTGTTAADLGLAADVAESSVRSGPLGRQYVNSSTALSTYGPGGKAVGLGSFRITDASGASAVVNVSGQTPTLGDVINRINSAGIGVTAALNDSGDGMVLADTSGGGGALSVADLGSATTAADLKIAGTSVTGDDGVKRIDGRQSVLITLDAAATVNDLVSKLNAAGSGATAALFDDGSTANFTRMLLTASKTGAANRLRIDDGGLNLGLTTVLAGRNALLQVGDDPATGVLLSSDKNRFDSVPGGLTVDLLKAGTGPVEAVVKQDNAAVKTALKQFVVTYNSYLDTSTTLTMFDTSTGARGVLQGDGTVLRVGSRLDQLLSARYGTDSAVQTLTDLGISFSSTGKLSLDESKFDTVMQADPEAVKSFFTDKENGFATKSKTAIDSFTDPFTGTFKVQDDSLATSIERIETRVTQLDAILEVRRNRLIQQFAKMEEALSSVQSQQLALQSLVSSFSNNSK